MLAARPSRTRPRDHLRRPPGGLRHRREGRHQRRHGGVPARVHAGRRRRHRSHRRPAVELPRAGNLHRRRRRPPDRQRAVGPGAGRQRGRQSLRARLAGQPDHRARRAPGDAERLRLAARDARPRNARSSRASSPTSSPRTRPRARGRRSTWSGGSSRSRARSPWWPRPAPRQFYNQLSNTAEGVLATLADDMRSSGNVMGQPHFVVILAGEHMRTIAGDGWSKAQIRQFLFEHTQNSHAHLRRIHQMAGAGRPGDETRHAARWSSRPTTSSSWPPAAGREPSPATSPAGPASAPRRP